MERFLFPLPVPCLTHEIGVCPRCRRKKAVYVLILFRTDPRIFWIVDAHCLACEYDIGKRILSQYTNVPPSEKERPRLLLYDGTCRQDKCMSDLLSVERGETLIAAACSNPICDFFVLHPGLKEMYEIEAGDAPLKSLSLWIT